MADQDAVNGLGGQLCPSGIGYAAGFHCGLLAGGGTPAREFPAPW